MRYFLVAEIIGTPNNTRSEKLTDKKFYVNLHIILYIKCDVFLEANLNCPGNDKITPGSVLES